MSTHSDPVAKDHNRNNGKSGDIAHKSSGKDRDRNKDRSHKHKDKDDKARNQNKTAAFRISMKFQNVLPPAPSGPFYKLTAHKLWRDFSEFSKSTVSTLEKNYVFKPHYGNDCSINLDLVDQEEVIVDREFTRDELTPLDHKYLKDAGVRSSVNSENLSFIRQTTYVDNNLYQTTIKGGKGIEIEEAVLKKKFAQAKKTIDNRDPYSMEYIESSFDTVDNYVEEMKRKNPKRKMLWSIPFIPIDLNASESKSAEGETKKSIMRFDSIMDSEFNSKNPEDGNNKKQKIAMENLIVTNIRPSADDFGDSLMTSIVLPAGDIESRTDAEVDGEDLVLPEFAKYSWMRDYSMKLSKQDMTDTYVISIPSSSKSSKEAQESYAKYFKVDSKMDMKLWSVERSAPVDIFVKRFTGEIIPDDIEEEEDVEEDADVEENEISMNKEGDDSVKKNDGVKDDSSDSDNDKMQVADASQHLEEEGVEVDADQKDNDENNNGRKTDEDDDE